MRHKVNRLAERHGGETASQVVGVHTIFDLLWVLGREARRRRLIGLERHAGFVVVVVVW